jgi:hypothetical protein
MCAEGDTLGVIELIEEVSDSYSPNDMNPKDLIRYQDPFNGLKTGLHLAVEKQQYEMMWLMLWLGSHIPDEHFPPDCYEYASGIGRDTADAPDIRAQMVCTVVTRLYCANISCGSIYRKLI